MVSYKKVTGSLNKAIFHYICRIILFDNLIKFTFSEYSIIRTYRTYIVLNAVYTKFSNQSL